MAGKPAFAGLEPVRDRFEPVSNPPPPEFDLPPPPPPFPAELGLGGGGGDGFCRDLGDVLKCDRISASFGYSLDSASLFRNSDGVKVGGDDGDESGNKIAAIAATAFVGTAVLVACVAVFLVWRRHRSGTRLSYLRCPRGSSMLKSSPSSAFETLRRNPNHSNDMNRNTGGEDIMFDDANINFVRDCGGGGGVYQAGPGVIMPRNKISVDSFGATFYATNPSSAALMSTVSDNDNDSGRIYEEVKLVSSANGDNRIVGAGSSGGGCCRVSDLGCYSSGTTTTTTSGNRNGVNGGVNSNNNSSNNSSSSDSRRARRIGAGLEGSQFDDEPPYSNVITNNNGSGADDSTGDYSTVYATAAAAASASKTLDVIRSNRSPFTIAPKMNRANCNANAYYCSRDGGGNTSPPGRRLRRSFREQHPPQNQDDPSGGFFASLWRRKKTASSDFDFGAPAPCQDRVRRRTEQNYGEVDRLPMVLQLQQMVPTTTAMTPHQHQRRFGQAPRHPSSTSVVQPTPPPPPRRHCSTLGGGLHNSSMPDPDEILPRAAWTDYSGGTMDHTWSDALATDARRQRRRRPRQESEPLLLRSPTADARISTKTTDAIAVSESSSDGDEEEGEVDDLIETEFARDVKVRGGPKLKRRKGDFHSASSSSNASSSVQR